MRSLAIDRTAFLALALSLHAASCRSRSAEPPGPPALTDDKTPSGADKDHRPQEAHTLQFANGGSGQAPTPGPRMTPMNTLPGPTAEGLSPIDETAPTAEAHAPTAEETSPTAEHHAPTAEAHAPTAEEVAAPTAEHHAPTAEHHAPTAEHHAPTAEHHAPTAECVDWDPAGECTRWAPTQES
jgi:hypothetical protein